MSVYVFGLNSFIYMHVFVNLVGVVLTLPNGKHVRCHAALLCATLDLPARAAVANFVQYNGYWGCGHCLQKGDFNLCTLDKQCIHCLHVVNMHNVPPHASHFHS